MTWNPITIISIAALMALLLYIVRLFNTLIGRKNQVFNAQGALDAMFKKRFDLIPNLVATVEKYMNYERDLLYELTGLRTRVISGEPDFESIAQYDSQITKALRQVFSVAENYPALRASEPFVQLQRSLNEVEEQLSAARRTYNAAVTLYNDGVEMFPLCLMARAMGYEAKPWLTTPEEESAPIKVWR